MSWCESTLISDAEKHWGFPPGSLTQGRIERTDSDADLAVWTRHGGVIRCCDAALADAIATLVETASGREPREVYSELPEAVKTPRPHQSCNLDVGFYTESAPPQGPPAAQQFEIVCGEEVWPDRDPDGPQFEHLFGIRIGGAVVSRAFSRLSLTTDGHRFYAIGAATHPDHQGRGLARAVVSALVGKIVSENGVALWNCEATNTASVRLAHSAGFTGYLWVLNWNSG